MTHTSDAELTKLFHLGNDRIVMAAEMGVSIDEVVTRCRDLGLFPPGLAADQLKAHTLYVLRIPRARRLAVLASTEPGWAQGPDGPVQQEGAPGYLVMEDVETFTDLDHPDPNQVAGKSFVMGRIAQILQRDEHPMDPSNELALTLGSGMVRLRWAVAPPHAFYSEWARFQHHPDDVVRIVRHRLGRRLAKDLSFEPPVSLLDTENVRLPLGALAQALEARAHPPRGEG